MLSIRKRFLFVHVPKTGGNSIQSILRAHSEDSIVAVARHQDGIERFEVRNSSLSLGKHAMLSQYKAGLSAKVFGGLLKLATLRNPWERMVSLYFTPGRGVAEWSRPAFLALVDQAHTLRNYIVAGTSSNVPAGPTPHPSGDISLDRSIDLLMRFESLEEDFRVACRRMGIRHRPLPHVNRSRRSHYSRYYDRELRRIVGAKFAEEVEYGGCEFRGDSAWQVLWPGRCACPAFSSHASLA